MSDIQEEVQSAKEENTSFSRKKKLATGIALALVIAGSPFIYSDYAHTEAAKLTSELGSPEFKELAGNEIQYKILNPTYERKNLVTGHSEMELVINYQGKIFTLPLSNEVSISGKVTSRLDTEKMSNEAQSFIKETWGSDPDFLVAKSLFRSGKMRANIELKGATIQSEKLSDGKFEFSDVKTYIQVQKKNDLDYNIDLKTSLPSIDWTVHDESISASDIKMTYYINQLNTVKGLTIDSSVEAKMKDLEVNGPTGELKLGSPVIKSAMLNNPEDGFFFDIDLKGKTPDLKSFEIIKGFSLNLETKGKYIENFNSESLNSALDEMENKLDEVKVINILKGSNLNVSLALDTAKNNSKVEVSDEVKFSAKLEDRHYPDLSEVFSGLSLNTSIGISSSLFEAIGQSNPRAKNFVISIANNATNSYYNEGTGIVIKLDEEEILPILFNSTM